MCQGCIHLKPCATKRLACWRFAHWVSTAIDNKGLSITPSKHYFDLVFWPVDRPDSA
jgi:hypothetical protein